MSTKLYGTVTKLSSEKTVKVRIERTYAHPKYNKRIRSFSNFTVHDELGVQVGDNVCLESCRPISKTKKYIVKSRL